MPNPKHPTKATTAKTQAKLTQVHQRLRVSVRLDTEAILSDLVAETERSNESAAGDGLSDGASSVGFTNDFPEKYGLG